MSNYQMSNKILKGGKYKIAIVKSCFNNEITKGLLEGCMNGLKECEVKEENVFVLEVPGAFELPIGAQKLAETKNYDAIVCLGAIIKGETRHDEYISSGATKGIIDVSLKYNIPVLYGVITAHNLQLAKDRSGDDENNIGRRAALSAIEMLENLRKCG